jgi:hypothetical protein
MQTRTRRHPDPRGPAYAGFARARPKVRRRRNGVDFFSFQPGTPAHTVHHRVLHFNACMPCSCGSGGWRRCGTGEGDCGSYALGEGMRSGSSRVRQKDPHTSHNAMGTRGRWHRCLQPSRLPGAVHGVQRASAPHAHCLFLPCEEEHGGRARGLTLVRVPLSLSLSLSPPPLLLCSPQKTRDSRELPLLVRQPPPPGRLGQSHPTRTPVLSALGRALPPIRAHTPGLPFTTPRPRPRPALLSARRMAARAAPRAIVGGTGLFWGGRGPERPALPKKKGPGEGCGHHSVGPGRGGLFCLFTERGAQAVGPGRLCVCVHHRSQKAGPRPGAGRRGKDKRKKQGPTAIMWGALQGRRGRAAGRGGGGREAQLSWFVGCLRAHGPAHGDLSPPKQGSKGGSVIPGRQKCGGKKASSLVFAKGMTPPVFLLSESEALISVRGRERRAPLLLLHTKFRGSLANDAGSRPPTTWCTRPLCSPSNGRSRFGMAGPRRGPRALRNTNKRMHRLVRACHPRNRQRWLFYATPRHSTHTHNAKVKSFTPDLRAMRPEKVQGRARTGTASRERKPNGLCFSRVASSARRKSPRHGHRTQPASAGPCRRCG